jgi:hypothetical protein
VADGYSHKTDLEHLFESKGHQGWELRKIRRRVQSFRNDVFFGETRLLKSVHDQAPFEKDAKKLMQGTVKVKLSPSVRCS